MTLRLSLFCLIELFVMASSSSSAAVDLTEQTSGAFWQLLPPAVAAKARGMGVEDASDFAYLFSDVQQVQEFAGQCLCAADESQAAVVAWEVARHEAEEQTTVAVAQIARAATVPKPKAPQDTGGAVPPAMAHDYPATYRNQPLLINAS